MEPAQAVTAVDLDLLRGIAAQREALLANTLRFARGLPANNALLWDARGGGKSSLIKAVHARVAAQWPLALVEIARDHLSTLPDLLRVLRAAPTRRCLLFCDDLSFDSHDEGYKSLKALLDGGLEGRPENAVFYATSNRRHLIPREMVENECSSAIAPSEATEEHVSLSDRFGLWLGFHLCNQEVFLEIVGGYIAARRLPIAEAAWRPKALAWSMGRGARSGRTAWQFVVAFAGGELGVAFDESRPLSAGEERPAPR